MKTVKLSSGTIELYESYVILKLSNPALKNLITIGSSRSNIGYKELSYIYFMYDYSSEHRNLGDEERHIKSLKVSGLPEDYELSKKCEEAIVEFLVIRETTLLQSVATLNKTLHGLNAICNQINKKLNDEPITSLTDDKTLTARLDLVERLITISAKIPQVGEKLLQLQEKAYEELDESISTYGDVEISEWEK